MLVAETVVALGGLQLRCRLVGGERGAERPRDGGGGGGRRYVVDAVRYVGLEVPSFHNNGLLDEPRAPPSAVGPMCCGGRTLLQCLFVTQARWHQLTK